MPENLLQDAANLSITEKRVNVGTIARYFQISFNRAVAIVEQLQQIGFCSEEYSKELGGYKILPNKE